MQATPDQEAFDSETKYFCLGVQALGLGLADEYSLAIAGVD